MGTLEEFVREEQVDLWDDLDHAIRYAINGAWSMAAANVSIRILKAARLVGPTPIGELPYRLSSGGVYRELLALGGIPFTSPTEERWVEWDAAMAQYGKTRAICSVELAATVEAIRSPRESAYIRGEAMYETPVG